MDKGSAVLGVCDNCRKKLVSFLINNGIVHVALTVAQRLFDENLEETRFYFEEAVQNAMDGLLEGDMEPEGKEKLQEDINEERDNYEEAVMEAWKNFKDQVKGESTIGSAAIELECELEVAHEEFEEAVKKIVDKHLEKIDETTKEDYEEKAMAAVNSYAEWASSAFLYFEEALSQLGQRVEEHKIKAKKLLQKQKLKLKTAKVKVVKVKVTGQSQEDLKGIMSEMVKIMKKLNGRLISLEKKLEQQDNDKGLLESSAVSGQGNEPASR